jgi:NitT/TauT family transport system substrate-binding protein
MNKKIARLFLALGLIAGTYFVSTKFHQPVIKELPKVRIGVNPWIGHGIYYLAQEESIFKQNNIQVEIVEYDDNSVGKQLLNSGKIDILSFTPDVFVGLLSAGVNVKAIAVTDNSAGADGIIAAKHIQNIQDLKNKTIAYETGSPSELLLAAALKKAGLNLKDINALSMPAGDAGAAFISGKVDIAVTWEPWLTKASEREGGHILFTSKELNVLPDFLMVRAEFLNNSPEVIKQFLKSYFDAVAFIKTNPDKIKTLLASKYQLSGEEATLMMQKFAWFDLKDNQKYFVPENSGSKLLTELANETWLEQKIILQKVNLSNVWDESFINSLVNESKTN